MTDTTDSAMFTDHRAGLSAWRPNNVARKSRRRLSAQSTLSAFPDQQYVTVGIEQALSEAVRLIDNALAEHRGSATGPAVVELPDSDESVALTLKKLIDEARRELVCVAPPESMAAGFFQPAAELLRQTSDDGPQVRVLIPSCDWDARYRIQDLLPESGPHEARLTETPLQEMMLADRRTALVISRFGPATRQTVLVRSPALLKTLYGLFTDSWLAAGPLKPVPLLGDPRQRETVRQVLTSLRNGQKDDVAARELGMSVRTYRRYVADFMRDIDATSRFQAGARAAEMRLLPSKPSN